MMPPHFSQRRFGIQNQLPRDMVRNFKRARINIPKQRVVDQPDERRDADDLLFAMRHQRDTYTAPVAHARPFCQKAGQLKTSDFGRYMGRGEPDMIGEFADGNALSALAVGDTHQHHELTWREIKLAPERVPAGQQTAHALHHRIDAEAEVGVGAMRQEFAARDGHGRPIGFYRLRFLHFQTKPFSIKPSLAEPFQPSRVREPLDFGESEPKGAVFLRCMVKYHAQINVDNSMI
jgi:hypothetical protein